MKLDKYQLKARGEFLSYEFISEGPKGLIHKRIPFTPVNRNQVFNLAFGDKELVTGDINNLVVSNNNYSEKCLLPWKPANFCTSNPAEIYLDV